jgi:hypothetical protein
MLDCVRRGGSQRRTAALRRTKQYTQRFFLPAILPQRSHKVENTFIAYKKKVVWPGSPIQELLNFPLVTPGRDDPAPTDPSTQGQPRRVAPTRNIYPFFPVISLFFAFVPSFCFSSAFFLQFFHLQTIKLLYIYFLQIPIFREFLPSGKHR